MIKLPEPIAAYVEATNAQAAQRIGACFDADATVLDEGSVRRGRDQIEAWAHESGMRYRATIEPVALEEADGRHRLVATVRGDFPGSPVKLDFDFLLQDGRIQALEIKP